MPRRPRMLNRTHSLTSLEVFAPTNINGSLRLHSSMPASHITPPPSPPLKRKRSELPSGDSNSPLSRCASNSSQPSPRKKVFPQSSSKSLKITLPIERDGELQFVDGSPEPPSPVPTEIVDNVPEDFVRTAKEHGVKVRDFAYESASPSTSKVPEVWRVPYLTLAQHDMYLRRPCPAFELSGKELHRLLDIGYLTPEDQQNWKDSHRTRLEEYRQRPAYPYVIGTPRPKPTAEFRQWLRVTFFGSPQPGDILDDQIHVPLDVPGAWAGDDEARKYAEKVGTMRSRPTKGWELEIRPEGRPRPLGWSNEDEYNQIFDLPMEDMPLDMSPAPIVATPPASPRNCVEELVEVSRPTTPVDETPPPAPTRRLGRTRTFASLQL